MQTVTKILSLLILSHGWADATATSSNNVPLITLEEHWASPSLFDMFTSNPIQALFGNVPLFPIIAEAGPVRLADMDANNVAVQVISHVTTAAEAMYLPEKVRLANDQLAVKVRENKRRFRGFCYLPMALPKEAAKELRRCVKRLGFVGALVDAHVVVPSARSTNGSLADGDIVFFDSPAYDVLWKAFVDLDVPLYLHPAFPPLQDLIGHGSGLYAAATVTGSYSDASATKLGMAAWGWHSHTGLSFLKLYLAGVFDRFPELQVVLGHMGEMVPFYLWRAGRVLNPQEPGRRTLRDVYEGNVHVTTAGIFSLEPMLTVLNVTDKRKVLYSVDYPFGSNAEGKAFMGALRGSGLVSEEEYEDIAFRNAKRLLKI